MLFSLLAQAKTEYVIGLTAQGIRVASVEDVELGFNYQLENITKNKSYSMKIKVFQNDDQLTNMLLEKKLLGYFGTPLLAVKYPKEFNLDSMYVPVLNDKVLQRYVLLVRKDSGVEQLEGLKNKSLSYCLTDEVGMMFLQKTLKQRKAGSVDNFFNKTIVKKNPNLAISAVFFKEAQAVIVLEADFIVASELNPQLKEQLASIETSPEYVTNILAITNHFDGPMTPIEYEENVLNIGGAIQSKKLLKSYNYGKLRKIRKEDLMSVRELINSLIDSKGNTP
jgi:ABC-type phosphate/phosphonate transport system substrate-binding protein